MQIGLEGCSANAYYQAFDGVIFMMIVFFIVGILLALKLLLNVMTPWLVVRQALRAKKEGGHVYSASMFILLELMLSGVLILISLFGGDELPNALMVSSLCIMLILFSYFFAAIFGNFLRKKYDGQI